MSEIRLLKVEEYDLWNNFVDESKMGEVYNYSWWLEAVTNNDFKILGIFEGNELIAGIGLPFYSTKVIRCPQLTQTNGIVFSDKILNKKLSSRFSSEKKYTNIILNYLDKSNIKIKNIQLNYNYINWQPFYWNGYRQTTNYTCIVEYSKLTEISQCFSKAKIRKVKKAEKNNLDIRINFLTIDEFYNYHIEILKKRGKKILYSYNLLEKLVLKSIQNSSGNIFSIHGKTGEIHAAFFVVNDSKSAHYLVTAIDDEYREFEGTTYLLKYVLEYYYKKLEFFNFEGSMIEGVLESHIEMCTDIKPYIVIKEKDTIMRKVKDILILLKMRGAR